MSALIPGGGTGLRVGVGGLCAAGCLMMALALAPAVTVAAQPSPQVQAALQTLLGTGAAAAGSGTAGSGAAATGGGAAGGLAAAAAGASGATPATPAAGGLAHAAAGGEGTRAAVVVQRGQTLDGLIRLHLPTSPLRVELLRDAIRQLNPTAFAPGAGYRLVAGARLQLPSREDQLRLAFGPSARLTAANDEAAAAGGAAVSAAAARRGWVRYP